MEDRTEEREQKKKRLFSKTSTSARLISKQQRLADDLGFVRAFADLAQQPVGQIHVEPLGPFLRQRLRQPGAGQDLQQRQNQDGAEPRRERRAFRQQAQRCERDGAEEVTQQHTANSTLDRTRVHALQPF